MNKIDISQWKPFVIEQIFPKIVKPAVYHTREVTQNDNGIPYVVRSKFNNGIKYLVDKPNGEINPAKVFLLAPKTQHSSIKKKNGFLAVICTT